MKSYYLGFIDAALQKQLHTFQKSQALVYIYIVLRNDSRQSDSLVPIPGRRLLMTVCGTAQGRRRGHIIHSILTHFADNGDIVPVALESQH